MVPMVRLNVDCKYSHPLPPKSQSQPPFCKPGINPFRHWPTSCPTDTSGPTHPGRIQAPMPLSPTIGYLLVPIIRFDVDTQTLIGYLMVPVIRFCADSKTKTFPPAITRALCCEYLTLNYHRLLPVPIIGYYPCLS